MLKDSATVRYEKMSSLARDILSLSQGTLIANLRFMDTALTMLRPSALPDGSQGSISTDGEYLFYSPGYILDCYRGESVRVARDYLHIVLHCVFHHPFIDSLVDRKRWDLACDIAVESVITGLAIPAVRSARESREAVYVEMISGEVKTLTAERIYSWLKGRHFTDAYINELQTAFAADDHSPWYLPLSGGSGGTDPDGHAGETGRRKKLKENWSNAAHRMQADLESFGKKYGSRTGSLVQSLRAVTREKYDYAAFLKSFAVLGEAIKPSPDEFDYIFYTYGLKYFGNMPLIEPLEYREERRVREFAIAIDTSGSVQGELVQTFITKTYNILMQEENFFTKINIHIIQCDSEIKDDAKITCHEDFRTFIDTMKLKGGGGTDFRPVFEYIDKLRRENEFVNFKGLIYFTDGKGRFPEYMPDYPAAFVFVGDGENAPQVPVWAIKLILSPEEIRAC